MYGYPSRATSRSRASSKIGLSTYSSRFERHNGLVKNEPSSHKQPKAQHHTQAIPNSSCNAAQEYPSGV